jgi:hypothetical protein
VTLLGHSHWREFEVWTPEMVFCKSFDAAMCKGLQSLDWGQLANDDRQLKLEQESPVAEMEGKGLGVEDLADSAPPLIFGQLSGKKANLSE